VSLLAASLPGVQLLPFHVSEPALPSITAEQWKQLLQKPGSSSSSSSSALVHQNAAIVLSSPHFVEVEKFLLRLSSALPGMPVGGQTWCCFVCIYQRPVVSLSTYQKLCMLC
jgi:hypothetical protein